MTEETYKILHSPSTSYWLKEAIGAAFARDIFDAAQDAEILFHLLDNELKKMLASQTTV
jgi:hypothetical protein